MTNPMEMSLRTLKSTEVYFYKYLVTSQVFYQSQHTYALVNLKPLVPGHILVVPLRTSILRFSDLTPDESIDYMNTLQLIHKFIKYIYKADALNIAIQDGPESGQSVPHLHTHVIPRYATDGYGDRIYTLLEEENLEKRYEEFKRRKEAFINSSHENKLAKKDEERMERSEEIMKNEAEWLSQELAKFIETTT
ncbi:uncharacterized protein SPAPADRAFT_62330 [Spathaspora passalidarum NRRL Y-27907]|uniref:Bis(5'-adenosyl)-triphosphatase n=1 Tax=Spathaspora passalidarum (strain NRRL Y-27907 / 11-Y1) TaxID=619300 RepID=G3ARB8_SPAPN|nr:uncharacterized protein SPAPADRAFT_62330 [Spathaspora passalidarum NRRL Y-27907]EGW31725.1 hypothetical protein SPAPADRAFT_62330 [Spathaspora passalidarum NRRL Y-27907]